MYRGTTTHQTLSKRFKKRHYIQSQRTNEMYNLYLQRYLKMIGTKNAPRFISFVVTGYFLQLISILKHFGIHHIIWYPYLLKKNVKIPVFFIQEYADTSTYLYEIRKKLRCLVVCCNENLKLYEKQTKQSAFSRSRLT